MIKPRTLTALLHATRPNHYAINWLINLSDVMPYLDKGGHQFRAPIHNFRHAAVHETPLGWIVSEPSGRELAFIPNTRGHLHHFARLGIHLMIAAYYQHEKDTIGAAARRPRGSPRKRTPRL